MTNIIKHKAIPPMTNDAIAKVAWLTEELKNKPQITLKTQHIFHAGTYCRTIILPANTVLTGALIKRSTLVIIQGTSDVFIGDRTVRVSGYNIIPASAGRKQAYRTYTETTITMIFATEAKTIQEAEKEFTDEYKDLMSTWCDNDLIITGE